jgi:hypothetical protein
MPSWLTPSCCYFTFVRLTFAAATQGTAAIVFFCHPSF